MKINFKKLASASSGLAAAALPMLAAAQIALPPPPITSLAGFQSFICTVVAVWMFTFLIILTVVFVLIAAFKYLTASGDPEKVKSASHTLIYAAIAIVVALFARGLPAIIGSLFSNNITAC